MLQVVDFGLAAVLATDDQAVSDAMGSAAFIAPEVARFSESLLGPPLDVWAVGVIAFLLLSGRTPFSGADDTAMLAQVRNCHWEIGGKAWGAVSAQGQAFVRHILQEEKPELRPSAAACLRHAWLSCSDASLPKTAATPLVMAHARIREHVREAEKNPHSQGGDGDGHTPEADAAHRTQRMDNAVKGLASGRPLRAVPAQCHT